jgi:hypothetical protein
MKKRSPFRMAVLTAIFFVMNPALFAEAVRPEQSRAKPSLFILLGEELGKMRFTRQGFQIFKKR